MKVISLKIFINALRVAEYVEETRTKELWDPSGLAMRAKIIRRKRSVEELEMRTLLKGQLACAVSFDDFNWRPESIDPAKISNIVRIIERTGKLSITGARFQRTVLSAADVKRLQTMPKIQAVRSELVGLLGGAAQTLAGTLSTPAGGLAFTLEGRHKAMEEEQGESS
jgi:ribosomal protein L10